jgi:HSP20 family protein
MLGWFDIDREFDSFEDFRRRVDRLFDEVHHQPGPGARPAGRWPRANLWDAGEALALELGMPGVKLEDLEISGHDDTLHISGLRRVVTPEGYAVHRQERAGLRFARSIQLPVKVELDKAEAALTDGILSIRLPKAPELTPRSIQVRAG